MVWFRWGCAASCGWIVRCVGVRGDAWPVLLSPCNTCECMLVRFFAVWFLLFTLLYLQYVHCARGMQLMPRKLSKLQIRSAAARSRTSSRSALSSYDVSIKFMLFRPPDDSDDGERII